MDKSSREKISKKCLDLVDIFRILCTKVLVTQLCLTFWDSMDCSPPGSSVHGNLQVRILEWVAIPFSGRSSWPRDWTWVSCIAGEFFNIWAPFRALPSEAQGKPFWTKTMWWSQQMQKKHLINSTTGSGMFMMILSARAADWQAHFGPWYWPWCLPPRSCQWCPWSGPGYAWSYWVVTPWAGL